MVLLIARKLCRLCKGNNDDRKTSAIEFRLERCHLAEVILAWQSGQMPEKNQQRVILEIIS
jgi:hypothetical protein